MKSRLEKVYGKLPNQKVELQKIELGLVDDVLSAYEDIKSQSDDLYSIVRESAQTLDSVSKSASDIISNVENISGDVNRMKDAFSELGIPMPDEAIVAERQLEAYRNELSELSSRAEIASNGLFNMLG